MNTRSIASSGIHAKLAVMLALWPVIGLAQVPVDDSGNPIGEYQPQDLGPGSDDVDNFEINDEDFIAASPAELEDLVGSIALYPDDLLAIILPASTYPLQLVEASRFLQELESNPSLQPDDDWDDSVVALTNYPEVIELLNDDLDWTWQLGEAVVAQQADVIAAIETFRDRAYAAGNLKSDDYQEVTHDEGVIEITPVNEEIIYVPYYEPERVVVYQPQPVYYYHPRPYPVYNYPYPYGHSFSSGYFWGVTTAFTIGWATDYLHVHHHSYYGHPYYGYSYNNNWWYRRPSISVHNTYYVNNHNSRSNNYYQNGDRWKSNNTRRLGSEQQVTRSRYRPSSGSQVARNSTSNSFASPARTSVGATSRSSNSRSSDSKSSNYQSSGARDGNAATSSGRSSSRRDSTNKAAASDATAKIKFRERNASTTVNRERQTGLASTTPKRSTGATANSGRQSGNSAASRAQNGNSYRSSTSTATARERSDPDIQFKPRNNERNSDSSRGRSSTPARNTTVARNSSVIPSAGVSSGSSRRSDSTKKATAAPRASSSTPSRSGASRSQPTPRAKQSSATQRQSRPTQSKSQSGSRKSGSSSASKKSESSSRSNNRSSSGKKSRSRDT